MSDSVILALAAAVIAGFCAGTATEDWRMRASSDEQVKCPERPDQAAFMGRKPGESHSVESCLYMMRFGNPNWIPEFSHPLKPMKRQPDAAWLLEALEQFERESAKTNEFSHPLKGK